MPIERKRVKEMIQFLNDNDIPFDEVDDGTKGKPLASYYIDDHAINFDNNWAQIAAHIYNDTLNLEIKKLAIGE